MKRIAVILAVACIASAANAQYYGGDFNGINGLASERDDGLGIGNSAYTYDNFHWNGGAVATVFGNFLQNIGGQIAGGEWEIRSGVSVGNGGVVVLSGNKVQSWAKKGPGGFGLEEWTLTLDGQNQNLAAGDYWIGVRPVGNGSGRSFVSCTDGAGGVGGPLNDDNSFFDSVFFGSNFQPAANFVGPGTADFSYGITTGKSCYADCDGSGELDVDDFICFQTLFGLGDLGADCDGSGELDIDDFICFQTAFGLGCP